MIEPKADQALAIRADFQNEATIPVKHVADGDNASPKLEWSDAPQETKSFVVIADDPDARQPKPFVHWIVYDIPSDVTSLREGLPTDPILIEPKGVKQGTNSMGSTGYTGPKPPVDDPAHNYHFQVFALDTTNLGIEPGGKRDAVLQAMEGHVLAEGELVGKFARAAAAK